MKGVRASGWRCLYVVLETVKAPRKYSLSEGVERGKKWYDRGGKGLPHQKNTPRRWTRDKKPRVLVEGGEFVGPRFWRVVSADFYSSAGVGGGGGNLNKESAVIWDTNGGGGGGSMWRRGVRVNSKPEERTEG